MNFEQTYREFIQEARACKMRAKKRLMKECDCDGGCGCSGGDHREQEAVDMVVNNMSRVSQNAAEIANMVQSSKQVEEWVHEKIAAVTREIDNMYNYLKGEHNKQVEPSCGAIEPQNTSMMPTASVMGDKPGAAPVGTYVFSTEKKHMNVFKKRKAGRVCNS